jgi:hypothetical protein
MINPRNIPAVCNGISFWFTGREDETYIVCKQLISFTLKTMRPIQWPVNDRLKPQIYENRTNRGYYAVATKEDGTLAAYTIASKYVFSIIGRETD